MGLETEEKKSTTRRFDKKKLMKKLIRYLEGVQCNPSRQITSFKPNKKLHTEIM